MDSEHLKVLLSVAGVTEEGEWSVLKDERTLTLHTAQAGVGLNIGKIRKVKSEGALLLAENVTGDVYVVSVAAVFAGSVDPTSKTSRRAGFR